MKNMQTMLNSNFYNKSQLIRDVSKAISGITNKQVKRIIWEKFGVEVGSNLIIAVLGKERTRKLLAPVREQLVRLGQQWFDLCGKDRGYCAELLSQFV